MISLFQRFGLGARKDRYPGALINGPGLIRILKLKSIIDDRIYCKLTNVDIAVCDVKAYSALSYRWGDLADPKLIYCNRVLFKVQPSLFQALFHIWSKDPELLIWVDAVCIDQNNFEELGSQVKIMGTVYQRARCVIIWLDEADEFTELAWTALLEASSPSAKAAGNLEARLAEKGLLEDIWYSLHNLGQREWFYRVWTFQELFLARQARVLCSNYEMDWDSFHAALDQLMAVLHLRVPSANSLKAKSTLQKLVGSVKKLNTPNKSFTLTDLLVQTIHRSCDEPKDKIYALLGVLFRGQGLEYRKDAITVNYNASPEAVYTDVSHALARRAAWAEPGRRGSEPLDVSILHGAGLDAHNRRYRTTWYKGMKVNRKPGSLPSWVTDWTDQEATFAWAEQTYTKRDEWRPIINTYGLKLGAAINMCNSRIKNKELELCGVVIARLVQPRAEVKDRMRFDLEDLPHCVCRASLWYDEKPFNGTQPYSRWTAETPTEDQARYPYDSPSRIYYAPKVLRALSRHDQMACECSRAPYFHTILASILALVVSVFLRPTTTPLFLVVLLVALKDHGIESRKPFRNFCLDIVITKDQRTAASVGDWIVSLAGEQGLFLLKPTKGGKFKLVRSLLRHSNGIEASWRVLRIKSDGKLLTDWQSQHQQGKGPAVTPSWKDFKVLPISLVMI
jgi:hypothetical protein